MDSNTVSAPACTGELKIAAALLDAEPLKEELKDFQRKVSDVGRATYNARVGAHDDLILVVAMALWFSKNMPTSSVEELLIVRSRSLNEERERWSRPVDFTEWPHENQKLTKFRG